MRASVLVGIVALAIASFFWLRSVPAPEPVEAQPRLTYVTTANQLGIVGYRDPVGAISPDGTRLAYAEGRLVRVMPIGGGPLLTLDAGEGQIRSLAWSTNDILIAEDMRSATRWWAYDLTAGTARHELWGGKDIPGSSGSEAASTIRVNDLRQPAWSRDGKWAAAIAAGKEGPELWRIAASGASAERTRLAGRPSAPAWSPSGEIACISNEGGRPRLAIPCGAQVLRTEPDVDVVGPLAFSADGANVYFASPTEKGDMVDLWAVEPATRRARRITSFTRDTYAPSVAADGTTLFKVQTYRTFVADAPASGGPTRQLTTFQSEIPSWHPRGLRIAFTYGTWRRVLDDANYPDIAQEIGVIDLTRPLPAPAPHEVIAQSDSEDQAMAWSPNGRWIAFHTHREMSDDVWLRPADGSAPDRRLTFLGRGAEVGWPTWSPDGQTILLDGARPSDGRSVLFALGVDQDSGEQRSVMREVKAEGFDGEIVHAEWLPGSATVVGIAKEGPGRHAIVTLSITGGRPHVVHRFASEHDFPGLGVSPDGRQVAFIGPAADGYFQVFRIPLLGGEPTQVTTDPSHKTQPAWSPDGRRIAFAVWRYHAAFWSMGGK